MTDSTDSRSHLVEAETRAGRILGISHRGVASFLGVPYGGTTAGERRFAPPVAPDPWAGVREAMSFGNAAPQVDTRLLATGSWRDVQPHMYVKGGHPLDGAGMGEDCLVLNVWTPALYERSRRPVMVWLHGGGFAHGSGGSALYHGDELASLGDVVVVTVNHRLGIHGFLPLDAVSGAQSDAAGNAGMLDIVLALQWVRENISEFGGDPANVTVFGQSGGGAKVDNLMAMPAATGLFHKAINQSGPGKHVLSPEEAERLVARVLDLAGLRATQLDELRALPMRELLNLQHRLLTSGGSPFDRNAAEHDNPGGALGLAPWLDGSSIVERPFSSAAPAGGAGIPMLVGYATHDASLLLCNDPTYRALTDEAACERIQRDLGEAGITRLKHYADSLPDEHPRLRYARVITDATFRNAAIRIAELKSQQAAPTYLYEFAYPTPLYEGLLGCTHSLDLPFVFHTVERTTFAGHAPERVTVSRAMARAWAAFAWSAGPGHDDIPSWPPFDPAERTTMRIDTTWRSFASPQQGDLVPALPAWAG